MHMVLLSVTFNPGVDPIAWITAGASAGALAGQILGNKKAGTFVANMLLGLLGAYLGGVLIGLFINASLDRNGTILVGALGAIIVVAIGRLFGFGRQQPPQR